MLEIWLITGVMLVMLGTLTVFANLADRDPKFRRFSVISILLLNGLVLVYKMTEVAVSFLAEEDQRKVYDGVLEPRHTVPSFLVILVTVVLATALLSKTFRGKIAGWFPIPSTRPEPFPPMPVLHNGEVRFDAIPDPRPLEKIEHQDALGFRADSLVHAWAAILVVHLLGSQFATFFLTGGLEGVAENIAVSYSDLISYSLLLVMVPLLGVGLFTRRDYRAILLRLGLRKPELKNILVALATAFLLLGALYVLVGVWMVLVSQETFEEQNKANAALSESITSLGLALTVAVTAAVGEEIAFRGALQPIFGLWPTAIVFTLAHTQYTLTPATLIILVVAIGLGYIRRHFDTTTAIIVHFLYNLVQLLVMLAASESILLGNWV